MLVQTHQLAKRYGKLTALDDCSLSVAKGEICGLLGPNGSGKTTLLRLLMGFLRPTAGTARIAKLDCYRDRNLVHRNTAYLPGEVRLFRGMNGHQILRFFSNVRDAGDLKLSESIASRFGLDLRRQVAKCSTGMRQMLALSFTLSYNVPLLILDEPTSNLDPTAREEVLGLIREARAEGRTVIFSSHVLSEAEKLCDRVLILRHGNLVHDQRLADLRCQHRVRAQFSGPMPELPQYVQQQLSQVTETGGEVTFEVHQQLTPLLSWLGTLPVNQLNIEPMGLQSVYDQYHPQGAQTTVPSTAS